MIKCKILAITLEFRGSRCKRRHAVKNDQLSRLACEHKRSAVNSGSNVTLSKIDAASSGEMSLADLYASLGNL